VDIFYIFGSRECAYSFQRVIRRLFKYRWRVLLFCQSVYCPAGRGSHVVTYAWCRRSCVAGIFHWLL